MRKKPYRVVCLGGTFDHLHIGHQSFIDFAANLAHELTIGITTGELTQHKAYPELIEHQKKRWQRVKHYCQKKGYRVTLISLDSVYGTTLDENSHFDAIAVTQDTVAGAQKINQARTRLGLRELKVHICPLVPDNTGKTPVMSARVRSGEISRTGEVYLSLFTSSVTLQPHQRKFFAQPQGPIVTDPATTVGTLRVVVGDESLKFFQTHNWSYDLGVYDEHVGRTQQVPPPFFAEKPHSVSNPPGTITPELIAALKHSLACGQPHLKVDGEEDLATVALVLMLPLQSEVYYGQPDSGMIRLVVTEELKHDFYQELSL